MRLDIYDALTRIRAAIREAEPNATEMRRLGFISTKPDAHLDQCAHAAWVALELRRASRAYLVAAQLCEDLYWALACPARTREQAQTFWDLLAEKKDIKAK